MELITMASKQQAALNDRQYWLFQVAGWTALAVFSVLSLNIWYTPGEFAPLVHSALQSVVGILISHPLRYVARRTWTLNISTRAFINIVAVLVAAGFWTIWRVTSFTWLTGEVIELSDWGGWINLSVIVFVAWSVSYHALKYYRLSIEQRQIAAEAQTLALKAQAEAQHENLKRLEAETLFRESQLRMLKYQLNPHFFLNALNSVSALVQRGKDTDAMEMLARIGDFLRVSLDDDGDLFHSLEEEIDAIETYLGIEKIRFGDRLATEFDIAAKVKNMQLPVLLLQPLFENAIKHAVSKRTSQTTLSFSATQGANGVTLTLADDGPGLTDVEEEALASKQSIGLANVRKRLTSTFGDKAEFHYGKGQQGGFEVSITIEV